MEHVKEILEGHTTPKPTELIIRALKNSSVPQDIVLDLFGGSGATLMAAEKSSRLCYMMELDPRYADVIRKRYANHIGEGDNWQDVTPAVETKELIHGYR